MLSYLFQNHIYITGNLFYQFVNTHFKINTGKKIIWMLKLLAYLRNKIFRYQSIISQITY